MGKGLRTALWVLSSLAMLWTALALVGMFSMGAMMGGMMGSGDMMGGGMMRGHAMGGTMMAGMMMCMVLTWTVMLGLDALFVYLAVTARRAQPPGPQVT